MDSFPLKDGPVRVVFQVGVDTVMTIDLFVVPQLGVASFVDAADYINHSMLALLICGLPALVLESRIEKAEAWDELTKRADALARESSYLTSLKS